MKWLSTRHEFSPVDLVLHFFTLRNPMNFTNTFCCMRSIELNPPMEAPFHAVFSGVAALKPGGEEGKVAGKVLLQRSHTSSLWPVLF